MSLTLFPITALLLLLSGMGTPAYPRSAGAVSSVALMKRMAGRYSGVLATWKTARTRQTALTGRTNRSGESSTASHPISAALSDRVSRPSRLGSFRRAAFARKLYRTRFGFPEGAYLALGPPATRTSPLSL